MTSLLDDAKQWYNNNSKELVLVFHLELVHEAWYNGLSSQVYLEVDDNNVYATDNAADDADGESELAGVLFLVGDKQYSCSAKR